MTQSSDSNTCPMPEDMSPQEFDGQVSPISCWGKLISFQKFASLGVIHLHEEKNMYICGRHPSAEICFNHPEFKKHNLYEAYSSKHFTVFRKVRPRGEIVAVLEDTSSNGTFVNGKLVGKGNTIPLSNNSEIALNLKSNKAFIFVNDSTSGAFPAQIEERFIISKILGEGAAGRVYLVFEKPALKTFAMKVIKNAKSTKSMSNEVRLMCSVHHPCVTRIFEAIEHENDLYLILEYIDGGELFDRVAEMNGLDEPTAKLLFYQMVKAVDYLHSANITHRDLKPENILLASDSNETLVKLSDFGASKVIDGATFLKSIVGTFFYIAPEIVLHKGLKPYTPKVDNWSLGVVLFICLCGYPPFSDQREDMDLERQIVTGSYVFIPEFWNKISPEAKDLVSKLLTVNPKKRISLSEALKHPWLDDEVVIKKAERLMDSSDHIEEEVNGGLSVKKRKTEYMDDGELSCPVKKIA